MDEFVESNVEFMGKHDKEVDDSDTDMDDCARVLLDDDFSSGDETHMDAYGGPRMKKSKETHSLFYVGQRFGSKTEVIKLVKDHAVETRRDIIFVKNDLQRVRARCRGTLPEFKDVGPSGPGGPSGTLIGRKSKFSRGGPTCPWVLHISTDQDVETWTVKTYEATHKCLQCRYVSAATTSFLAEKIRENIISNPTIPINALQTQLQQKYEINVSAMKALRAKTMACQKIWNDYEEQFNYLRDYICELKRCNPGTTVKLDVESEPNPYVTTRRFKRIYVCLGPLKEGFKAGKRDLLGLDGTFMKGPFPGQVLTAVGIDPNNSTYPLAYGIVEAESYASWSWFLKNIGDDLDLYVNTNFTFIRDRQKGILPAVAKLFPCAEHRFCLRHLAENMKKHWKGKAYKDHLWKCATATTVPQFQTAMEELNTFDTKCYEWLKSIPPQNWSRSHFTGRCHSDVPSGSILNKKTKLLEIKLKNLAE